MSRRWVKEFLERRTVDEQRWQETLETIDSVKSGRSIDEKNVNEWLDRWGSENESEPPTS